MKITIEHGDILTLATPSGPYRIRYLGRSILGGRLRIENARGKAPIWASVGRKALVADSMDIGRYTPRQRYMLSSDGVDVGR